MPIVENMTEQAIKQPRRTVALPSVAALDTLVRWANKGPDSLITDLGPSRHVQRSRLGVVLRRLVTTLGVPDQLAAEILEPERGRDFGELSTDLLGETARLARLGGYVTLGCRERVPLTPVQAHTLMRLSWGATYSGLAAEDGGRVSALAESMGRAREDNGCATSAHLVACAFRNGWLPDHAELRILLSKRMVWSWPVNNPLPPYLWTGRS